MASNSLRVPIRESWYTPPLPPEVFFLESYSGSVVWRQACCLNNGDSVTQLAREKSNKGEAAVWQAWASCLRTPPAMKAGKGKVAEFDCFLLLFHLPLILFSYQTSKGLIASVSITLPQLESFRKITCHSGLSVYPTFSFQNQHLESQLFIDKIILEKFTWPWRVTYRCNIWTRNWAATFSCSN